MWFRSIRRTIVFCVCGALLMACGAPTPPSVALPTTAPAAVIGQEVVVGSTAWIVKSVTLPGTSYTGNGRTATTGGQFVVVELQVTNRADVEHTLDGDAAELFTTDHRPYKPDTEKDLLLANPRQCLNKVLAPQQMIQCLFIYAVLPNTKPNQLLVTELGSSTSAMIDLTGTGTSFVGAPLP